MVRPASRRTKKFKEGVDPERIKKVLEKVKPGMVEKQSKYFAQIVMVEEKAKRILEEAGVPSYQIAQYLIVARQCYSIASKFRGGTRDLEAQNVVNHWNQRGLDGTLLQRVCEISGCDVFSPGPGFVPAHTHIFADITDTIANLQAPQFFLLDCTRGVEADFEPDIPEVHSIGSEALAWRRGVFQGRDPAYLTRLRIGGRLPSDFPVLPDEPGAFLEFYMENPPGTPKSKYFLYYTPVLTGEGLYLEGIDSLGTTTTFMTFDAVTQRLLLGGWFLASTIGSLTPDNRYPLASLYRQAVNMRMRDIGSGENDEYRLARKKADDTYEWRSLTASKIGINGPWRVSGGDLEGDENDPFVVNGELWYNTETEELEVD